MAVNIVNKGFQQSAYFIYDVYDSIMHIKILRKSKTILQGKGAKKIFYKKPSLPLI